MRISTSQISYIGSAEKTPDESLDVLPTGELRSISPNCGEPLYQDSSFSSELGNTFPELESPQTAPGSAMRTFQMSDWSGGVSGDLTALLVLMEKCALEQRASARDARRLDRELQSSEILKQVEDLRSGAMAAMIGGIVSGGLQISGGALQLRAVYTGQKAVDALPAGDAARTSPAGPMAVALAEGQAKSSILAGVGSISASAGQGASALKNADAAQHQANASRADAQAQDWTAVMQSLNDMLSKVRDALKAIQDANLQAERTVVNHMV